MDHANVAAPEKNDPTAQEDVADSPELPGRRGRKTKETDLNSIARPANPMYQACPSSGVMAGGFGAKALRWSLKKSDGETVHCTGSHGVRPAKRSCSGASVEFSLQSPTEKSTMLSPLTMK
jgi:hypothetical protein